MMGNTVWLSPQTRHADARFSLASRQTGCGADLRQPLAQRGHRPLLELVGHR
jgi:hypothetical protein